MATLKEILKSYFSSGKKPKEQQFHEWIDSYVHKTEDGLSISPDKNIGIGTADPKARLHVEGGIKIGPVTEDPAQLLPGTLRWTGTKLQILFGGAWQDVWSSDKDTTLKTALKEYTVSPVIQVKRPQSKQTATLDFPNNARQLLKVSIDLSYTQFLGSQEYLIISLFTANDNKEVWTVEQTFQSTLGSASLTLSFDISGIVSIENKPKFYMKFQVNKSSGGGGGLGQSSSLEVTIKKFDVTCMLQP
ncbi:MAG: hypothetical protein IPM98_13000 [Lewinellaceae bacterium]|nr:hypothetical protein [Lewinellaceae bacterium]